MTSERRVETEGREKTSERKDGIVGLHRPHCQSWGGQQIFTGNSLKILVASGTYWHVLRNVLARTQERTWWSRDHFSISFFFIAQHYSLTDSSGTLSHYSSTAIVQYHSLDSIVFYVIPHYIVL